MENESDLDYMHVPPDECSGFCGESIGTYFCRICPSDLLPKREDFPPMHAAYLHLDLEYIEGGVPFSLCFANALDAGFALLLVV